MAKTLDWDRSYARRLGAGASDKRVYEQDGSWFDAEGNLVEAGKKPRKEVKAPAKSVRKTVGAVSDPIVDPSQQASRENAAAAAAEDQSEDA